MIEKFKILAWNDTTFKFKVVKQNDTQNNKTLVYRYEPPPAYKGNDIRFGIWRDGKWIDFNMKSVKQICEIVNQ